MKCVWVLIPAVPGAAAVYCQKPTRYKVIMDKETGIYESFCPVHQAEADAQDTDWGVT